MPADAKFACTRAPQHKTHVLHEAIAAARDEHDVVPVPDREVGGSAEDRSDPLQEGLRDPGNVG